MEKNVITVYIEFKNGLLGGETIKMIRNKVSSLDDDRFWRIRKPEFSERYYDGVGHKFDVTLDELVELSNEFPIILCNGYLTIDNLY